jgi:hypothetical protein
MLRRVSPMEPRMPEPLERACMAIAVELFLDVENVDVAKAGIGTLVVTVEGRALKLSRRDVRAAVFLGGRHVLHFVAQGLLNIWEITSGFCADEELFQQCPAARRYKRSPLFAFHHAHVDSRVFAKAAQYAAEGSAAATALRGPDG